MLFFYSVNIIQLAPFLFPTFSHLFPPFLSPTKTSWLYNTRRPFDFVVLLQAGHPYLYPLLPFFSLPSRHSCHPTPYQPFPVSPSGCNQYWCSSLLFLLLLLVSLIVAGVERSVFSPFLPLSSPWFVSPFAVLGLCGFLEPWFYKDEHLFNVGTVYVCLYFSTLFYFLCVFRK